MESSVENITCQSDSYVHTVHKKMFYPVESYNDPGARSPSVTHSLDGSPSVTPSVTHSPNVTPSIAYSLTLSPVLNSHTPSMDSFALQGESLRLMPSFTMSPHGTTSSSSPMTSSPYKTCHKEPLSPSQNRHHALQPPVDNTREQSFQEHSVQ
ncbi:hypothetical protein SK128_020385 [Halocaridina rubra]|uniref:Uncharacterized protein n=1 Tax=Halocaridina rubra TaxID=373956 RepID=A0AAN9ACW6_HALRR